MNKEKVKEIIKFSFFKYFQNKWFIIFNVISLLSLVISLNWSTFSSIIPTQDDEKIIQIAILDTTKILDSSFYDLFKDKEKIEIKSIDENTYTSENIPDDFIILEVYPDETEMLKSKLISKEGIRNDIPEGIAKGLKLVRNDLLKEKYNLSEENLNLFQNEVLIERIMLGVDAENSELKNLINSFSSALTYFIAVLIFTRIANEISQEKSSKASEYVLTAVSSKEYLFAKVFSNIAILLIQVLLLLAYFFISSGIKSIFMIHTTDISLTDSLTLSGLSQDIVTYLFVLIFYNIITLILMSIIQATLAARTTSSSEAGNSVSILIFIMMLLYFSTLTIIDPYSKVNIFLYIISMLPIVSSFFVPAMIVIGQATWWQILISVLLLIVLIPKVFNICAVLFKNGLLDYTKKKKKSMLEVGIDNSLEALMNRRTFKQLGNVIGIAILIYMGTQFIIPLLLNMVIEAWAGNIGKSERFLILQIATQVICLSLAYLFVKAYRPKTKTEKVATKLSKPVIVLSALAINIILQLLLNLIYPHIGLDYNVVSTITINSASPVWSKILLIATLAISPAIFEELFFRKGLIDLCEKYGKTFALVLSALLFGFIHMNLSQGFFAFILGLIMGAIYLYTKDLKLTMLIHFINNGYEAISMILPNNKFYNTLSNVFVVFVLFLGLLATLSIIKTYIKAKKQAKENAERVENNKEIETVKKSAITNFKQKYIYIFYDFMFDISMVLLLVATIMQEKLFRNM